MRINKLMLFGYDFPHKKTQDFIVRLYTEGYQIAYVIGAPWEKLDIPRSKIRISPNHTGLVHPRVLCKALKIPYVRSPHNSNDTIGYLRAHPTDLSIISGARILSKDIIEAARSRVLNIHPGLLPEVRGLDTLLWSIQKDVPAGLSAHFISTKIDSGLLILRETLRLYNDDTLIDISLRLLESQTSFLIKTLQYLRKLKINKLKNLNDLSYQYQTKIKPKQEKKIVLLFNSWLKKYTKEKKLYEEKLYS